MREKKDRQKQRIKERKTAKNRIKNNIKKKRVRQETRKKKRIKDRTNKIVERELGKLISSWVVVLIIFLIREHMNQDAANIGHKKEKTERKQWSRRYAGGQEGVNKERQVKEEFYRCVWERR